MNNNFPHKTILITVTSACIAFTIGLTSGLMLFTSLTAKLIDSNADTGSSTGYKSGPGFCPYCDIYSEQA